MERIVREWYRQIFPTSCKPYMDGMRRCVSRSMGADSLRKQKVRTGQFEPRYPRPVGIGYPDLPQCLQHPLLPRTPEKGPSHKPTSDSQRRPRDQFKGLGDRGPLENFLKRLKREILQNESCSLSASIRARSSYICWILASASS